MESKEQISQTALEKHQGYWGLTKAEEVAIYEAMELYAAQQTSTLQAENVRLREGLKGSIDLLKRVWVASVGNPDKFNNVLIEIEQYLETAEVALKGKE